MSARPEPTLRFALVTKYRLTWKKSLYKHSSLFCTAISDVEEKSFTTLKSGFFQSLWFLTRNDLKNKNTKNSFFARKASTQIRLYQSQGGSSSLGKKASLASTSSFLPIQVFVLTSCGHYDNTYKDFTYNIDKCCIYDNYLLL